MATTFLLGEYAIAIDHNVENPFCGGDQRDASAEELSKLFENVLRQPGGSFGIPSLEAKFDRDCVVVCRFSHHHSSCYSGFFASIKLTGTAESRNSGYNAAKNTERSQGINQH